MGEELTGYISDLFVFHVVLNCVIEINWIDFTELHVIDADAVVGQGLTMNITNRPANLQEFLILGNGLLEFTEVIKEDAGTVV